MRVLIARIVAAAPAAHAARPFVTDDARIVDKGGCQVETFLKRQSRYDESEFWFLPACNPWGAGAEVLLAAPRWYGIVESYGQRGEKPTLHAGLRLWIVPDRVQVDATVGRQQALPERRFATVGLRILW